MPMQIDATAPEGNVYFIMAAVRRLLIDIGREDKWPAIEARMKSGDYNNACDVAEEVTHGSVIVVNRRGELPYAD